MTENEISELREIVAEYASIDKRLNGIKEKLETYRRMHDELRLELDAAAEREKRFIDAIGEKYGKVDYNELLKYITDTATNEP